MTRKKAEIEKWSCTSCGSELDHSHGRSNYKCNKCGATYRMRTKIMQPKTRQISVIDMTGKFERVMAKVKTAVLERLSSAGIANPFDGEFIYSYVPGNPVIINPSKNQSDNTAQLEINKKMIELIWDVIKDAKKNTMSITDIEMMEILTAFFVAAIQKDKPAYQQYLSQDKESEKHRGKSLELVTPGKYGQLTSGQALLAMTQEPKKQRNDTGKKHVKHTKSTASKGVSETEKN